MICIECGADDLGPDDFYAGHRKCRHCCNRRRVQELRATQRPRRRAPRAELELERQAEVELEAEARYQAACKRLEAQTAAALAGEVCHG